MTDRWGDVNQATAILSRKAGRIIDISYVRSLVRQGKIESRAKDGRTNEYNLTQCENYTVKRRKKRATAPEEDEHEPVDMAV